jgi:hypothetical protein
MSVLMLFIDGIGIGNFDPAVNPFAAYPTPFFTSFTDDETGPLPHGGACVAVDVTMGVDGLPQSATGQTALLTGQNASQLLNRHLSGFPPPTLRKVLKEKSIFLRLQNAGKTATFANAFTPSYFQRSERSISATTWAVKASHFPLRMLEPDLRDGRALTHDITNRFLSDLGYDVPVIEPEDGAMILCSLMEEVDFCLFEYFLTDLIGHRQDMEQAAFELEKLDFFLHALLLNLDLREHTLLLTSDHGNFEDLGTSSHTRNAVPAMIWGSGQDYFAANIRRIEDIAGTIYSHIVS